MNKGTLPGRPEIVREHGHLSSWQFLQIWFQLGLNSFGGGAATIYLIRRAAVEHHCWLSSDEFTRDFAICQLTPGINILALTILIGRRWGGARGVALALMGLLVPSVTITIALTAMFVQIQQFAVVQAAVRGVIPATVGLGVVLAWNLAHPLLQQSQGEGRTMVRVSSSVLVGSVLVALLIRPPVVLILVSAGVIGGVARFVTQRTRG
jgi:chromate transporter